MADAFSRFYAAFNSEWPQFGMTPDEAQLQERRWRHAIGDFSTEALAHALTELVRTAKKRPRASEVVEHAQAFSRMRSGLRPMRNEQPDHLCSCGCGSTKWLKVLLDDEGKARVFAENPTEYLSSLDVRLTPYQREYVNSLVGQPLTRVMQACAKSGSSPLPDVSFRIGFEGQLPVFDLRA